MDHRIETLLSQADQFLVRLKQPGGHDFSTAETEIGSPDEEPRRIALQLLQINTNSLSRTIREKIRSTLVTLAPLILHPEEVEPIQESERQRAKLTQELAQACTRDARRGPTRNLRRLEEQQILFLRGVLKDLQKKLGKLKRERKSYFRAIRGLEVATPEKADVDTISITDRWQAEILKNRHVRKRLR